MNASPRSGRIGRRFKSHRPESLIRDAVREGVQWVPIPAFLGMRRNARRTFAASSGVPTLVHLLCLNSRLGNPGDDAIPPQCTSFSAPAPIVRLITT